jgi:predicted N-acyltransferase
MTMVTEVFESIEQIDFSEWNQLVAGRSFADWRWFQVTEALLANYQPRYLLLRENGQIWAGAVCSINNQFHSRLLQSTIGWLPRQFPTLRCDAPVHFDSGLFFSDPDRFTELFPELLRNLQTLLQQERISFYSFDHLLPTSPTWTFLRAKNYHRIKHVGAEINLEIRWTSFEDYLESLLKQEYEEYLQTKNNLEAQSIIVEAANPSAEDLDDLQRLQNNYSRYVRAPKLYHNDLYRRAYKLMGEDFKLVVARRNGKTIGCIVMLRSLNDWIAKWMGLNDEFMAADTTIYYGMLAECIHQAILAGGNRICMGTTVPPTIQSFGGTLGRRIGAMSIRNRPLHWMAGWILGITANPEPEVIQPVKNS